ncbi:MAG TPA: 5-formyltetrahydrofolate cyclo-ligase [Microbacteriaceae bacterium]|nr:5-formyltetrahydrofolate cyclo-ligase [Microbacteriaceae bacterium]
MTVDTAEEKLALRSRIRAGRRAMPQEERQRAATALGERLRLLTLAADATCVSAYLSSPSEPGTRDFLAWARAAGVQVLLPLSRPDGLLDWAYDADPDAGGGERMTTLGVPESTGTPLGPAAIERARLIFAPAAAVGSDGTRLGWGKGYFDRMLTGMRKCPQVYAVVFDGELLARVPRELHDRAVDGVVTPSKTVRFDRPGLHRPRPRAHERRMPPPGDPHAS